MQEKVNLIITAKFEFKLGMLIAEKVEIYDYDDLNHEINCDEFFHPGTLWSEWFLHYYRELKAHIDK